jgi:hypothetical protein
MTDKKPKIKQTSFLDPGTGDVIELIGDNQATMFVVYNVLSEKFEVKDTYEFNEVLYVPPKDDLVANDTILLPTYPEFGAPISDLVNEIEDFIYRYLDVSDSYRKLASYYVILTWVYDCFEVLPYLRALGDYGTGKTRFQKVIGSLCYKPMFVAGATTPSPIFRIINLYRGTLIMDEADFRFSDTSAEIIKILNCGYCKGVPVLRTEGDARDRTPTSYVVYGPKIIATRKRFDDSALESRCLTEIMSGRPRTGIPIHLPKQFDKEALKLRNLLLGFRLQNYGQLELNEKLALPHVEPRINQIILPILSIAKDEDTQEEITQFIKKYAENLTAQRGDETPAQVLRAMVLMVSEGVELKCKEIAKKVNSERSTEQGERPISPTTVGRMNSALFNFRTRRVNGKTEILWDIEKGKMLCERYDITLEKPVEVVEDVEVSQEPPPMIENDLEAQGDLLVEQEISST